MKSIHWKTKDFLCVSVLRTQQRRCLNGTCMENVYDQNKFLSVTANDYEHAKSIPIEFRITKSAIYFNLLEIYLTPECIHSKCMFSLLLSSIKSIFTVLSHHHIPFCFPSFLPSFKVCFLCLFHHFFGIKNNFRLPIGGWRN